MAFTRSIMSANKHAQVLKSSYPWTKGPLVVGAPMRIISGPALALKISGAGGLGFIGPGAKPEHLHDTLKEAKAQLKQDSADAGPLYGGKKHDVLPIGTGFQTWAGDLKVATEALSKTRVAAVWLFAPRHGHEELSEWTKGIREASPETKIWIQVASVKDAIAAATSKDAPDVLVIQGTDAGGHSLKKSAGIMTLLPEVADALQNTIGSEAADKIPLIAAGGIIDSRGAAAALALGASGVALGTRFLASHEANLSRGYQDHVVGASDGGQTTVRTQHYNHLRGTMDWPEEFDARGLINQGWRDHAGGMDFEESKRRHDEAMKKGDEAWGEYGRTATYAGTGVGLVREVKSAAEIVQEVRGGVQEVLNGAQEVATMR